MSLWVFLARESLGFSCGCLLCCGVVDCGCFLLFLPARWCMAAEVAAASVLLRRL